ncbi:hypothetical protein HKD37_03G008452 [Glycine soja]
MEEKSMALMEGKRVWGNDKRRRMRGCGVWLLGLYLNSSFAFMSNEHIAYTILLQPVCGDHTATQSSMCFFPSHATTPF